MQQRRISLMTVFLPRENLFFIEEWLKYHIVLGFTHFYLYNNSGSRFIDCGNNIELNTKNRRGESIYPLLAHYTDAEVQDALENILAPFVAQGYVTQVMWQPRDEHGNITYAQSLAFLDYVAKYARETDWVSFTDLDEFIVPLQHEDVQGLVDALEQEGFTYAILPQKCFASRFDTACQPRREVLRIFECSDWVTAEFGRKALIKADTLRITPHETYSIHAPGVEEALSKYISDGNLVRFNHYKFNAWELNWVKDHLHRNLQLNMIDEGMRRFYAKVRQLHL